MKNNSAGFSLIELLIVMAIMGIIAAVALPAYTESRLRASRAEGKAALIAVASDLERYYSSNSTYVVSPTPLKNTATTTLLTESGKYSLAVAACAGGTIGSCFLITATPQGSQADDVCKNLTLTSIGVRGSSAGVASDCWQR